MFVIVNSLLGSVSASNMGGYAVSKWDQRARARTLQQETRDVPKIHVCTASPGSINTPVYRQAASTFWREARQPVPVPQPETAGRHIADLLDRPRRNLSMRIVPGNPVIVSGSGCFPGSSTSSSVLAPIGRLDPDAAPAGPGSTWLPPAASKRVRVTGRPQH